MNRSFHAENQKSDTSEKSFLDNVVVSGITKLVKAILLTQPEMKVGTS